MSGRDFGLVLLAILLGASGQVMLKAGMRNIENVGLVSTVIRGLSNPTVLSGFLLYLASAFAWLAVLQRVELSIAYPMLGLLHPLVVVASYYIFREPITWPKVAGVALIFAGIGFIGYAASQNQAPEVDVAQVSLNVSGDSGIP